MDLLINTTAVELDQAAATSLADLTAKTEFPWLTVGDSEALSVKFLDAVSTYAAWSGQVGYTPRIALGFITTDGEQEYAAAEDIVPVTNGWTARLDLSGARLRTVLYNRMACRARSTGAYFVLQVSVIDPSGRVKTYARLPIFLSGTVAPA